jgi:hypothetical protein
VKVTHFVCLAMPVLLPALSVGMLLASGEWQTSVRQSVTSAKDLYQKALREFETGDTGALITLRNACRRYEEAVDGDPSDVKLFIERCRAKRLLAEKSDPNDGGVGDRSLEWLMQQQRRAGHWTFLDDHEKETHDEEIRGRDDVKATCIALLAMFGGGQSQQDGRWRTEIEVGLTYVVSEARIDVDGIDYRGARGNTATHALATMLLCEAYAMTNDARLAEAAQRGVKFLESLQYQDSGGWGVVGDDGPNMVATAWCVMALQSAKRANLAVEPNTKRLVEKFLSKMQTEEGAFYGAIKPGKEAKATAAGLLCRCLLGWTGKKPALVRGAEYLATPGTIGDDVEARFFATQVMFHAGGDLWKTWNRSTRDMLFTAQARDGRDLGSWSFHNDASAKTHGRLWHTALSALTLEVYYRYLTMFKSADSYGLVEIEFDGSAK